MRKAVVIGGLGAKDLQLIQSYMPDNYKARRCEGDIVIEGEDVAGWTLTEYVIPRLASGLIVAKEIEVPEVSSRMDDATHGVITVTDLALHFDTATFQGSNPRKLRGPRGLAQEIAEAARWCGERGAKTIELIFEEE